jgi:hypothetical protein
MSSANSSSRFSRTAVLVLIAALTTQSAVAQPKHKPAPTPHPTPAAAEPDAAQQKKDEARARFEKGMSLFDKKIWDAALAEFLESRAAYPTRSNTQNAALCLKNLNRFDEALDMFEALLKEFPNLGPADKQAVQKEVEELRGLVGTVEIHAPETGAQVTVDGRERGQTPAPPVRVAAGSHVVRVYKEGFQPFEKRVEVAGRQNVVIDAKLETLAQSGKLSVTEDAGKPAEVVVDNVVMGKTPWQGLVSVGDHVVFLRGDGNLGTQPTAANVHINQVTPIVLALEPLECPMRVEPTPSGATVAIDGVVVGAGLWDGRLRKGRHKVEIAQMGFVPQERVVDLAPAKPEHIVVSLERDPNSPLWRIETPPKVYAELSPSFPVGIALGGDVGSSGSASFPLGVTGKVHAGYELRSGIGFGVDVGYMYLTRDVNGRSEVLHPVGKPDSLGIANDTLSLRGLLVGASAHLHKGKKVTWLARLGVGAMLGNASDRRAGDGFTQVGGPAVSVDTTRTATDTSYLYVAPEARVGYRIGKFVEIAIGAEIALMVALKEPRWDPAKAVVVGNQGLATYGDASIFGSTILLVNPGITARFEF